ncbi:hypothetical protein [Streptomyces sp. NPDC093071]|uniref:hypothetical protein n=1 Tax=Streptomyces sp. NPDC093071 TaxID=3366022 RepID=UPI00380843CB
MAMLDKAYIENHMSTVHNYQSFGRNVVESGLREALTRVEGTPKGKVELDAKVIVTPVEIDEGGPEPRMCIRVRMIVGGVEVWVHIYTGEQ